MGKFVNSAIRINFPIMPSMDPLEIKNRLDDLGRGARTRFAEALSIDTSTVAKILNGSRRVLASELPKIQVFFDQAERMPKFESPANDPSYVAFGYTGRPQLCPVYGTAMGSDPSGPVYMDDATPDEYVPMHPNQVGKKEPFALRVINESMSPRFEPGEIAYCIRNQHPRRGQDCIIEMKDGGAYIKQYAKGDGSTVFVRQLNPEKEIPLALKEIKAIHAVVGRG